ncbi:MAG TPA: DUF370 domain-containing protein [Clostridiaceae bacterium]|nr:DUF370 domain-containing protein [Clostridiaceae bacterium]
MLKNSESRYKTLSDSPYLSIGFGNAVAKARLIAVVGADGAPVRRLIQDARDRGALIDATAGKKTRAVLIMDSDHIVLSAEQPETLTAEEDA